MLLTGCLLSCGQVWLLLDEKKKFPRTISFEILPGATASRTNSSSYLSVDSCITTFEGELHNHALPSHTHHHNSSPWASTAECPAEPEMTEIDCWSSLFILYCWLLWQDSPLGAAKQTSLFNPCSFGSDLMLQPTRLWMSGLGTSWELCIPHPHVPADTTDAVQMLNLPAARQSLSPGQLQLLGGLWWSLPVGWGGVVRWALDQNLPRGTFGGSASPCGSLACCDCQREKKNQETDWCGAQCPAPHSMCWWACTPMACGEDTCRRSVESAQPPGQMHLTLPLTCTNPSLPGHHTVHPALGQLGPWRWNMLRPDPGPDDGRPWGCSALALGPALCRQRASRCPQL